MSGGDFTMDVKQVFERNSERLNALYAGQDQLPRYAALVDDFRAHFGCEPEMFVSAPGRTEVVGNHTDHQNGRVLAGASTEHGIWQAFADISDDDGRTWRKSSPVAIANLRYEAGEKTAESDIAVKTKLELLSV